MPLRLAGINEYLFAKPNRPQEYPSSSSILFDANDDAQGEENIPLAPLHTTSRHRRHRFSYLNRDPNKMKFSHSLQFNSVPDW